MIIAIMTWNYNQIDYTINTKVSRQLPSLNHWQSQYNYKNYYSIYNWWHKITDLISIQIIYCNYNQLDYYFVISLSIICLHMDNTYNGWTNRATWLVWLHFEINSKSDLEYAREHIEQLEESITNNFLRDFVDFSSINWSEIEANLIEDEDLSDNDDE